MSFSWTVVEAQQTPYKISIALTILRGCWQRAVWAAKASIPPGLWRVSVRSLSVTIHHRVVAAAAHTFRGLCGQGRACEVRQPWLMVQLYQVLSTLVTAESPDGQLSATLLLRLLCGGPGALAARECSCFHIGCCRQIGAAATLDECSGTCCLHSKQTKHGSLDTIAAQLTPCMPQHTDANNVFAAAAVAAAVGFCPASCGTL